MKVRYLKKNISETWNNLELFKFEELNSTNDWAKKTPKKNDTSEILVLANQQTNGRGRNGRNFYSKIDHGLYFSIGFLVKDTNPKFLPLYTIAAAVAMIEAVDKSLGMKLKVKWVNDLFYQGRKVGGILAETITNPKTNKVTSLIIGIGLNLAGSFDQADELTKKSAGTLYEKIPDEFNQEELIKQFLVQFASYHENLEKRAFIPIYEQHMLGIGREVYYHRKDKKYTGQIEGINEQGQLLIKNEEDKKIKVLIADEIHFSSQQFVKE